MAKYVEKEIEIYQGDSYQEEFRMEIWNSDLGTYVPRDLTGLRMDMHIKTKASQALTPAVTASTETGEITFLNVIEEVPTFLDLPESPAVSYTYRIVDTDELYVWHEDDEVFVYWKQYEAVINAYVKILIHNPQTRLLRGGQQYAHDIQIIDGEFVETFRVGAVNVPSETTDVRP